MNATSKPEPHKFETFKYPDGTEREILSGRTGKDGKWYVYPICNREDCGMRKSAKVHA
jgi:hypothetical protein